MIQLHENSIYLVDGRPEEKASIPQNEARKQTMAWQILQAHNTSGDPERLKIRFDAMVSHDITYVGIIQQARASGMKEFPIPYALTNCHNSLCAVGGTINEDDHVFGLSAAKKYGGIYVPANQSVIHSYAREELARCGAMILGSDSHTRYGALGTMAVGEGGPELVKQLLSKTYDIDMPGVVGVYLTGTPRKGVGPQDIALAIIGEVFDRGYVKNKVMEFVGPGVSNMSVDYRIGVDVMTTETTCLSSIWRTDDAVKEFYEIHGREGDYKELNPAAVAYYDGMIEINLDEIKPMIAMRNGSQSGATLYASSRSAQGTAGPDFRLEMEGLQYSEIPMLAGSNPQLMQQALGAVRNDYSLARLYAMGVDAWALANHFTQMRQVPGFELNGNTGDLTATQDCVINRKLSWLKYQQGQIVPAS